MKKVIKSGVIFIILSHNILDEMKPCLITSLLKYLLEGYKLGFYDIIFTKLINPCTKY